MNPHTTINNNSNTFFAPADRVSEDILHRQIDAISNDPILTATVRAFSGIVLVLNKHRQIVGANIEFLKDLGLEVGDQVFGMRPGEVLQCASCNDAPGGCGTGSKCKHCGAAKAILESVKTNNQSEGECLLTMNRNGQQDSFEFKVTTTPVKLGDFNFIVCCMNDISDQKRRHALERIFFHDVLNTIGGLRGWAQVLSLRPEEKIVDNAIDSIERITGRLTNEIRHQQSLMAAESGKLVVHKEPICPSELLKEVAKVFEEHTCSEGKTLQLDAEDTGKTVITDHSILGRILTNMIKNAFEATKKGNTVTVGYRLQDDKCFFHVHNEEVIPKDVAEQIFRRSFSTKATYGRGLGTYSMKLFGERYLGGKISFVSSEGTGTTFTFELPI